jgi:hypothetical protein
MSCKKCGSERVAEISGKCSDMSWARVGDKEHDGYVPSDMGIGGSDYIEFNYCLDCGQMQGEFPLPKSKLEGEENDGDDDEEEDDGK